MIVAEQKRQELIESIRSGKINDPVTIAISVGISVGGMLLSRMLAPKPPTQQIGLMKGTVQIQNSQQGIFIPEIYGAAPTISLVTGAPITWADVVNATTGADGKIYKNNGSSPVWGQVWDSGAVDPNPVGADDDAFIEFVPDISPATFMATAGGFSTDTTPASGLGVGGAPALEFGVMCGMNQTGTNASSNPIYATVFAAVINGVRTLDLGIWAEGDKFRVEKRAGVYHLYKGLAEVTVPSLPTPSSTLYIAYSGWRTNYGMTTAFDKIGGDIGLPPSAGSGGVKVPAMLVWAVPPLKHSFTSNQTTGTGKHSSTTAVENVYYTIDLRANYARGSGGLELVREYGNTDILIHQDPNLAQPSGVFNSGAGDLAVYSPTTPPDPTKYDNSPVLKYDSEMALLDGGDPGGGSGGSIQGGASQIAVYPGSMTQDVDPTEEADVDAKNGLNSTPAHRGMAGVVHTNLNLQRWDNLVPNQTAVWQHKTLKTLDVIYLYLGKDRIVDQNGDTLLVEGDFDFSDIPIKSRGMLIDGRRFSPAEIIDNPEIQDSYNYFTTEGDGKILAFTNGNEPAVVIPWQDIGWVDGSSQAPSDISIVSAIKIDETKLPRQIDLRYINPGSDWEPDTQSFIRKVTLGNTLEQLQVQVTLNPDEARAATVRREYRQYVGEPVKFTLSWKYLHLFAGYRITTTDPGGITYIIRLTSIAGGIGVRDCDGILLEPSAFHQDLVGGEPIDYNPPHPIPASTILAAMDVPAFRPGEQNIFGIFFGGSPRQTDTQQWSGWALYIKRTGQTEYSKLAEFSSAAIMGKVFSVTGTLETDPTVTDSTSTITVDLYGTKASLLNAASTADMVAGTNRACAGDMIIGFATPTRVDGYPNRWNLTVLRNGQYGTEDHIADDLTGRNFAFFDSSVKLVPLNITDIGQTIHLKAVSFGQDLSDAIDLTIVPMGNSLRMPAPFNFVGFFDDGGGDLLEEWAGVTPSFGSEIYELQHLASDLTTVLGKPKIIDPVKNRQLQEYVVWDAASFHDASGLGTSTLTLLPDGGVDILGALSSSVQSATSAEVVGGLLIEFQIPISAYLPSERMSLFPSDSYGYNPDDTFSWGTGGSYPNYTARPEHDFSDSPGPTINISAGDRLGIYMRPDGIVEYHINHMPNAKPVFISSKSVQTTKRYFAYVQGERSEKVSWLRQGPEFKYSAAQQRLDNGLTAPTLPGTIYARVRQLAPIETGPPGPWTYATFVR